MNRIKYDKKTNNIIIFDAIEKFIMKLLAWFYFIYEIKNIIYSFMFVNVDLLRDTTKSQYWLTTCYFWLLSAFNWLLMTFLTVKIISISRNQSTGQYILRILILIPQFIIGTA